LPARGEDQRCYLQHHQAWGIRARKVTATETAKTMENRLVIPVC
jgi:hypothetical protein